MYILSVLSLDISFEGCLQRWDWLFLVAIQLSCTSPSKPLNPAKGNREKFPLLRIH